MLNEQLLLDRAGNFTASENHKLMAGWDNPEPDKNFDEFEDIYGVIKPLYDKGVRKFLVGELKENFTFKLTGDLINKTINVIKQETIPTGLITYAEEKAVEELFDFDPSLQFSNIHTRNGEDREDDCIYLLSKSTGVNFSHTGDGQIHIHSDGVGCTPDGVVLNEIDLVETGAEVKCKSAYQHAKNLTINNSSDLKENEFEHYVQVQTAMLVTGTDYWYFANYNPFAKSDELKFKYIIVDRDNEFIEILKKRIEIAKKIKLEFMENIKNSAISTRRILNKAA